MNSPLWMIFNSRKGAKILSEEFEGDLSTRSTLIYLLFGELVFMFYLSDLTATLGGALNTLMLFLVPVVFFIYGSILTSIIYYLGRLLGSKIRQYETFTIFAYSMIPLIIGFVCLVVMTKFPLLEPPINTPFNQIVVAGVASFVSVKVVVLSLWRLGKINFILAVFNTLPIFIVPIVVSVEVYHFFEWIDVLAWMKIGKSLASQVIASYL